MKQIIQSILKKSKSLLLVFIAFMATGCDDFLSIDPPKTEIVKTNVFTSDASALSALNGIYSSMMSSVNFTRAGIEEFTGIASDEMINFAVAPDQVQFFNNALTSRNALVLQVFWREAFRYITNANAVLEGMEHATGMSAAVTAQVRGEALFIRAFAHYYLAALFGDVPYLTTTDYRVTSKAKRLQQVEVWQQIANDLMAAEDLLITDYSYSNNERTRPNRAAASAMLARVYLYLQDWQAAEAQASSVIADAHYALPGVDQVFIAASSEAIWQLKPVIPNANTQQALLFTLTTPPNATSRRVSLRDDFVSSFELDDDRRMTWVASFTGTSTWHYAAKYKVLSSNPAQEYNTVLRLAEQFLIRAEARVQLDDLAGAAADLNTIRERAGLPETTADENDELLEAILEERRHELFAEWGHRWIDLKRFNKIDAVLGPLKTDWQSTDALFPVPESERLLNPNLSQNAGY